MKILVVHNEYQQRGGEDSVVEREIALLRGHGHAVSLYGVSNHSIRGTVARLSAALNVAYSQKAKASLSHLLSSERPDVVHVHNWFPLLSPSIYDACRNQALPVVQSLHNFRVTCSAGLLMRDGEICEDCITGSPYQALLHRCYRSSFLGTLPVAHMIAKHRSLDTWNLKVDRFIAATEFGKSRFVAAGIHADRIVVKPNFADFRKVAVREDRPVRALYVGRLSEEKGVATLLEAWSDLSVPLTVVGDGPLMDRVRKSGLPSLRVVGPLSANEVAAEMSQSSFLVVPSICYETFSMVVAEAFSMGLPVVASRIGSLGEIVEHEVTGLHFRPGDTVGLRAAVERMAQDPAWIAMLGRTARETYLEKYTPERNYRLLMEIYSGVRASCDSTEESIGTLR